MGCFFDRQMAAQNPVGQKEGLGHGPFTGLKARGKNKSPKIYKTRSKKDGENLRGLDLVEKLKVVKNPRGLDLV